MITADSARSLHERVAVQALVHHQRGQLLVVERPEVSFVLDHVQGLVGITGLPGASAQLDEQLVHAVGLTMRERPFAVDLVLRPTEAENGYVHQLVGVNKGLTMLFQPLLRFDQFLDPRSTDPLLPRRRPSDPRGPTPGRPVPPRSARQGGELFIRVRVGASDAEDRSHRDCCCGARRNLEHRMLAHHCLAAPIAPHVDARLRHL